MTKADNGTVDLDLMRRVCDAPGVSGFEGPIREVVRAELAAHCGELRVDRMGNLTGIRRATRAPAGEPALKVMVAAHMDEIGFVASHIDAGGFVRILPIGGYDPRTLIAERVVIHGRRDIAGVIAPQPNWILSDEDKKRVLPVKELYIDTGLSHDEVAAQVCLGDPISFARGFDVLNGRIVVGRNFDDRIGVYVMLDAVRRLGDLGVDLYAVATVQEELGVRGAEIAAYAIDPDVGIAIDGSLASDVPYAKEEDRHCSLGAGTGIYLVDNRTVSDPLLVRSLLELAERRGIRAQRNIGGGTDASAIQRNRAGARACTIGAPTRYMHSTSQLCDVGDVEETVRLLVAFLENAHSLALR
jgi:putative aminopeptidase FrvX